MTKNTIISTGNTYRIYDDAVQTHDALPNATYRVQFSPMSGYSLQKTAPLTAAGEVVYGQHPERIDRAINAYNNMERSLGVMMSGDKGMGKSLMIRMLADAFSQRLDLPIVVVEESTPGIATFLDTLGECVVVFDEFEKKFDMDDQNALLGLFDGMSNQKRAYVLSLNSLGRTSEYLVNRPGRFHYHIRFDYPTADEARVYLTEQAPSALAEEIENAVNFTRRVPTNYDHLRSIAFELELGGKFRNVIGDLNIKRTAAEHSYIVRAQLADGTELAGTVIADLFGGDEELDLRLTTTDKSKNIRVLEMEIDTNRLLFNETGMVVPQEAMGEVYNEPDEDDSEERKAYRASRFIWERPVTMSLELKAKNNYAY